MILNLAIEQWLIKTSHRTTKFQEIQQSLLLLAQRAHTNAFITKAKTQKELLEIIKQLSHESPGQTSSKKKDSNETQSSNETVSPSSPTSNASSGN